MIIHLVTASNNSQTCSLFMSQIYQPKMKCKDGGLYFYKNQKYRQLEKEKKKNALFSYFISGIPSFPIWAFSENIQCFVGVFL